MTIIVDLREAASVIEADFSHLWIPQDPRCWYRPGAFDPLINPATTAYFTRNGSEFVPIKEFEQLPVADIYNWRGLVIPRELVHTLLNKCTQPTRGLNLVQRYLSGKILRYIAYKPYRYTPLKDWYIETLVNPELLKVENIPTDGQDSPKSILWNMLDEHWYAILSYMMELDDQVRKFVEVNPWAEYVESFRHHDLILERRGDIRIEFFEKYHYLEEEIQRLHRKAQEEEEIIRRD
jgi:hypothetical protein